ncbi:efflux RND transporter permease subunit [Vibrio sinaloensis]|nr:efflux RND transporter permease subunit [Vibrio sinaloensis]
MTTAAMIAGLIPLMYASGAGAAQRFSIGIVIVAGLAIGTIFTLFVLPVIYSYLAEKNTNRYQCLLKTKTWRSWLVLMKQKQHIVSLQKNK